MLGGTSLLGGRGTFIGTLLGAGLIVQVLNATTFLGLTQTWQYLFQGALIVVAAVLYSQVRGYPHRPPDRHDERTATVLAARFHGQARHPHRGRRPPAIAAPDDVLVEVHWCGICGTDLHEYAVGPIVTPTSRTP